MIRRSVATFLMGLSLAVPGLASAEGARQPIELLLIQMAESADQHATLGRYFRSKATVARAEADRIEARGRNPLYLRGNAANQRYERARSAKLALALTTDAERYDALALVHEEEAQKLAATQPATRPDGLVPSVDSGS